MRHTVDSETIDPDLNQTATIIVCGWWSLVEMTIGMGFPMEMGIPREWELMTKLGMKMGRNGKQPAWEWKWPLLPWK